MEGLLKQLLLECPDITGELEGGSLNAERLERLIKGCHGEQLKKLKNLCKQEETRLSEMSDFYPTPDQVMHVHMMALAQYDANGPSITGPASQLDTGSGAVSASSIGGKCRLHVISLTGLRTSAVPCYGAVIGGRIAARYYRNHATAGAVTSLMRSDDGALCRLALYNLPREVELGLTPNRRIVVKDVWFKRFKDGFPGLRVDDPTTIHFDTTSTDVVDAAAPALTSADPMADALAAKEEGTAAFRTSRFSAAMEAYTRGLNSLLQAGDVRLVDFGISTDSLPPPVLQVAGDDAVALAVALLNNRAAAALKVGRTCRALMDTQAAMALAPTQPKSCYRRAQALMSVGAWSATVECLAPHIQSEAELKRLSVQAEKREAGSKSSIRAAFLAASRDSNTHDELVYTGPIKLQRLGGRKGRGWTAAQSIEAGQILIVEPGTQVQMRDDEDDKLLLFQSVLETLSLGGCKSDSLRDQLSCMHPLAGEVEDSGTRFRDQMVEPMVRQYAAKYSVPLDDARHFERVVQRNQFSLAVRLHGTRAEPFGAGLFPLCSSFNHSCFPNAVWRPLDGAMVVISTRSIPVGEEICVSYHDLSEPGVKRKEHLLRSHGFECSCERCTAKPGSALFETERKYFGLICPAGSSSNGHLLCPIDPYSSSSKFKCLSSSCSETLSGAAAQKRVQLVHDSFEALRAPFRRQDFLIGCEMAQSAAKSAGKVIGPSHHEWSLWAAAANGHASGAGIEALIVRSCDKAEEVQAGHALTDDNVFMRVNSALALGLAMGHLSPPAAQALRRAYEGHKQVWGLSDFEIFLSCWVPAQFHGVCRMLK